MRLRSVKNRRDFIMHSGVFCVGLAVPLVSEISAEGILDPQNGKKEAKGKKEEEISRAEDLMREHGVLNRILLIYEEHARRLDSTEDFDPPALMKAADIIRRFVEDYHEKLEEDYLFARFRKAGKLADLVEILSQQHQAGRRLTGKIQHLAAASTLKDEIKRHELSDVLRSFVRMYRPHEAREDTVLFPALRGIISKNEYDSLGDEFEKKEDELFGEDGFFKVVDQVADLEKKLGIYDLSKFTPK